MRLADLPDTLLREVCESLTNDIDVVEEFFKAFGFQKDIMKESWVQSDPTSRLREILVGILKRHPTTPVQVLRDVCASLFDDDVVVDLLDNALLSYKPGPSLHLVRPLEQIRRIHEMNVQRRPISYIHSGAILVVHCGLFPGIKEFESFFMYLDRTSEVTILDTNSDEDGNILNTTLDSWQQNQGQ